MSMEVCYPELRKNYRRPPTHHLSPGLEIVHIKQSKPRAPDDGEPRGNGGTLLADRIGGVTLCEVVVQAANPNR